MARVLASTCSCQRAPTAPSFAAICTVVPWSDWWLLISTLQCDVSTAGGADGELGGTPQGSSRFGSEVAMMDAGEARVSSNPDVLFSSHRCLASDALHGSASS